MNWGQRFRELYHNDAKVQVWWKNAHDLRRPAPWSGGGETSHCLQCHLGKHVTCDRLGAVPLSYLSCLLPFTSCCYVFRVAMVNSRADAPTLAVMGSGGVQAGRLCGGCGGRIADRFLLFSMEQYWHTRCLKCSCCHAQLGEYSSTCYSKGGMILCKNDYIR